MNRRDMITTSSLAVAGFVVGTAASAPACPDKKEQVDFYASTVIGGLKELRPLFPNLDDKIGKAISVADTFAKAYREDRFVDAATIFENLTTTISEVITALGVMNETVKLVVATGGIALRSIAVLLRQQASANRVVASIVAANNSSAKAMIERMADPSVIDQVVAAVKP